ncbi:MAG: excinuclease ABC subunit UvrA, partial [Kiritimatiellae bacterium]|nr:excinuclease ABC subunit UvrA [Kiritimatiellia bacterium]
KAAAPVFDGLSARLRFLEETGLGYLTLDRAADTLSGGEARRVRLASALSQDLSGALYVLDEPTAGLHPRDTAALLAMLGRLRDSGNTLVVVEHDENVVRAADWVIDMGPGAGARGGRVVYSGSVAGMMQCADSPTGLFLAGKEPPYRPGPKAPGRDGFLEVRGARAHNLKGATAHFPIGCMTGVSGVSGSGKSSLVADVLGANLSELVSRRRAGDGKRGPWIDCDAIGGFEKIRRVVQVGRCVRAGGSRSVVATACGAFDRIRALFASTELARARGYGAGRFSFHAKGGRCEACRGEGERTLEMAFLPDSAAVCEECGGRRYNRETLDVHWAGLSIADVLDADVAEAGRVFRAIPALSRLFSSLESFGLGYLTLGQRVSTLSGGEAQRLLLAAELATGVCSGTLYILDEPASGQHPRDVNALVKVLESLRSSGGTIVAVEHRPQVLRAMDWIVELGPGAGPRGGEVVAEGVPAAVAEAVGG